MRAAALAVAGTGWAAWTAAEAATAAGAAARAAAEAAALLKTINYGIELLN